MRGSAEPRRSSRIHCLCGYTLCFHFSPDSGPCGFRIAPPTILAWEAVCFLLISTQERKQRYGQRIWSGSNSGFHCWSTCSATTGGIVVLDHVTNSSGLCPSHQETHPSFYVNATKNLFYRHGCGQGGDLIRFVQLFLDLPFRQTVAHLKHKLAPITAARLLEETAAFISFGSTAIRKRLATSNSAACTILP